MFFLGILRPCDQYPSEPGVLKSRPLSAQSNGGVFMGNLKPKSYESEDISEPEIETVTTESASSIKVGRSFFYISYMSPSVISTRNLVKLN
jgi:hypothetical protein